MYAAGKTHREIAEYFGFQNREVTKGALKCEHRKEQKVRIRVALRPKGHP